MRDEERRAVFFLSLAPVRVTVPGGDEPSAAPDTVLVRLEENIGAAAIELTSDDLREIDNAASQVTVHGARYPEALEQMTGR
jgi:hypothetical protein